MNSPARAAGVLKMFCSRCHVECTRQMYCPACGTGHGPFYNAEHPRITPDEAAVQDAYMEGQRAGHLAHERGQNPWPEGTPERDAWERGRIAVVGL